MRVPIDVPSRRRVRALAQAIFQPYDRSAGLLLFGALGIVGVLIVETIGGLVVLEQGPVDALYGAGKTVATVDPNQDVDDGPQVVQDASSPPRCSWRSSSRRRSPPGW